MAYLSSLIVKWRENTGIIGWINAHNENYAIVFKINKVRYAVLLMAYMLKNIIITITR